ncbi:hypothetical protein JW949_03660 [Candidatus Woesearchaeota archaeon]|nr:hypothetical protein [Candidatus Woesearchaeota archaeon]
MNKEQKEIFKPYFEAVRDILNKKPVKDLEEIRLKCNKNYFKLLVPSSSDCYNYLGDKIFKDFKKNYPKGYTPELVAVTHFADLENRILLGEDASEVYSVYGEKWENLRLRSKGILRNEVKKYLD